MALITWKVYIDFDVDGSYATAGDDITSRVMDLTFQNGMQNPYQLTSDEAELTMRLSNYDKRFSPEYSAGTYYGKLLPQKPIRVQAIYSGSTATMYQGWIDTFDPSPMRVGELVCMVRAIGAKQTLQDTEVYLSLMQQTTADAVIAAILGQVTLPPVGSYGVWRLGLTGASELGVSTYLGDISSVASLETGSTTFAYVGDSWENGINANDAIERVCRAERGRFFYTREGSAIFWNHQHLQIDNSNDGTVNNTMVNGDYSYGKEFFPIVRVNCSPRTITPGTATLWTLEKPVRVDGGGTATIRARYNDSSGAQVAGTAVLTPTPTVSSTDIILSNFSAGARSAEATFTNSGVAGSVTGLVIQGTKLTQFNQMVVEAIDGTVAGLYGRKILSINADLIDNTDDALNIANYELNRRKFPTGAFRNISMQEHGSASLASQMFNLTIGSRINVQETHTAHNKNYFILGEQWHVSDALRNSMVTWTLEPADTNAGWLIETAGFGELDSTTYVGF